MLKKVCIKFQASVGLKILISSLCSLYDVCVDGCYIFISLKMLYLYSFKDGKTVEKTVIVVIVVIIC